MADYDSEEEAAYLLSLLSPRPEPVGDPIEEAADRAPDEWSMHNLHHLIVFMPGVSREVWARVMVYCCGPRFRFCRGRAFSVRSLDAKWWDPYNYVTIWYNWWVNNEYPRWAKDHWPTEARPQW